MSTGTRTATGTAVAPATVDELAALLRARPGRVRLVGGGSRQDRLPAPPDGATSLRLDRLRTIVRLDPGDQTCVAECGVPRAALDAALAPHALELPFAGGGTLGGLFASDPAGAATFAGPAPRSLLLGLDGVLADGTPFRSGARVVKSVAGFDVHKLLVGSEGRLFVAARLFLRLKPRPRASAWFREEGLELARALDVVAALRRLPVAPGVVQLRRERGAWLVTGRVDGRPAYVAATLRELGLHEAAADRLEHVEPAAGEPDAGEVIAGNVLPSALPLLAAAIHEPAPWLWHGGGRFEAAVADAAAGDALLTACERLGVHARVVRGAPARRGRGTPIDAGQQRLAAGLHRALDPDVVLC